MFSTATSSNHTAIQSHSKLRLFFFAFFCFRFNFLAFCLPLCTLYVFTMLIVGTAATDDDAVQRVQSVMLFNLLFLFFSLLLPFSKVHDGRLVRTMSNDELHP